MSRKNIFQIVEEDIAIKIVQYNSYLLKGNLDRKREILLALSNEFEPIREEFKKINKKLASNCGFLLNKLNIRHNNNDKYVSKLTDEEIEI